jgi:hypothetical protein
MLRCLFIFFRFSFERCRAFRSGELYSSATRFRKPNRDGLLRRSRTVFAIANMVNFFAHKLTRLRRRSLAFTGIFPRSIDSFLLGHNECFSQNFALETVAKT